MIDTWASRELPVLICAVDRLDEPGGRATVADIANATGLSETETGQALRNLSRATPPYLAGIAPDAFDYPIIVTEVSERALRTVGAWPSAEQMVDEMSTALEEAADAEADPEQRSRLRTAALGVGGAARSVLLDVATRYLERQIGV